MESQQGIYDLLQQVETGWNAGDSAAFTAPFAEDVDFINSTGGHYTGRSNIDASYRHILNSAYRSSRNHYAVETVRYLRPDVAIAFLRQTLEFQDGRKVHVRPTAVLTKDNGKWQIAALQNTLISDARP
ncbi:MAG TPA: SgcJ/EcaC family oxidoreductase [Terriglobales bacterium]|jgi:uncharacterized protein (TIGR02246 family)